MTAVPAGHPKQRLIGKLRHDVPSFPLHSIGGSQNMTKADRLAGPPSHVSVARAVD